MKCTKSESWYVKHFFAELKALKERNEAATIADLKEQKLGISIAEQYP